MDGRAVNENNDSMLYAECWGYDHREMPEYPLVCVERQPEQKQVCFPGTRPKRWMRF